MYNWSGRHAPDWDEPGAGLYPLRHGHIPQRSQEGGNILQEIHKNFEHNIFKKEYRMFQKNALDWFFGFIPIQYFLNP